MLIGVPKEIKDNEYRVGMVPATVTELVASKHRVIIETGAGIGAGPPMTTTRRRAPRSSKPRARSTATPSLS